MDPSVAVLTNAGMNYRPLATGRPHHRRFPTQGLPFTGGPYGGVAAMAANGPMRRMMGDVGMIPMGVGHDQNVYDRMMNEKFTMMQMQAMQMAAQADRDEYMKTFRGLAAVSGTPFGGEQRRAAMSLANSAVMMSPMFAEMMPEFLDQLGGTKGSNAVLARRFIDAGRYRIDPVTGRMGMSAESVGNISNRLYGDLYSDENTPKMRGVTAGQVGSMIQELQSRGMISTAAAENRYHGIRGDDPRAATYRAVDEMRSSANPALNDAARRQGVDLTKPGGLRADDLDKLALDPAIGEKLRGFDANRVKRSIQNYVGVVSAMRDIFGDMGKPNAPMAELMAGIEALTMGGTSQINPGRMAMMVRNTYNLSKQTGVSMDTVLMLQQHAANHAAQMGIEPAFAVQATQGGLAFGGAYRAQGHGAFTAWGAMNADQVQQLDTNLRVQASSSNTSNRMATAVRMSEQIGGFSEDSEAGRYVAAIRGGMSEYRGADDQLRSVVMSDREFTRMMTSAKARDGRSALITEGDVQTTLGQRDTNREYVEKYNMGDTVRRVQGTDELHPFVGHRLQETLTSRFRDQLVRQGMDPGKAMARAREASGRISQKVTRRMFDMSTEEFADTDSRNKAIAGFIDDELSSNGMGDVLDGLDPGQREDFLRQSADRFYGSANRSIRGSSYRSFGNLQNIHRLTNKTTLDESDRQQMQARFTSENQEAMSALGRGSSLQRAVDALKNMRADDPRGALGVLAESLGGVKIEDVNRALLPRFNEVNEKRKAIEALQNDIMKTQDPASRAALMEKLDVARRELTSQTQALAKTGEQYGLFTADTLTHQDLARAMSSSNGLLTAQGDTIGLSGNFGSEVTGENISALRGSLLGVGDHKNPLAGPLNNNDRMAVVVARRQRDIEAIRRYVDGTPGATLTEEQQAELTKYVGLVRQSPAGRGANDYAANRMALDVMSLNVNNVAPQDLAKITADVVMKDADAAKAVVLSRRQMLPYRPSDEAVSDIMKERPQMTKDEAYELAATRLRAARLGLDKDTVQKHMAIVQAKDPTAYKGSQGEAQAVNDLLSTRATGVYDVTPDDITEYIRLPGYIAPDKDAIKRFREANPELTAGKDDLAVNNELHRRMVFERKKEQHKQRFGAFWGSNEGAAFREQTDATMQDAENVASKLISSPQMIQRLGTRGIEISDQMRTDQQRLRELALYHTGGDVSRLMARDFSDIKAKTPEEAKQIIERLNSELSEIQSRQKATYAELMSSEGTSGRRFQLGGDLQARREVLDREVAAGRMDAATRDKILSSSDTPGQNLQIEYMRRHLGSEAAARTVLGINPQQRELNDMQRIGIAAVRFGAGSEDEARLIFGSDAWEKLDPTRRAEILQKMQKGTGSDESAMALLNISQEQLKNAGPDSDLAKKIRAVNVGLTSDKHVKDIIGDAPTQRPDETVQAFEERKKIYEQYRKDVPRGLFSPTLAREKLGLPADAMPAKLLPEVDKIKESWGNEEEAFRLMGKRRGDQLSQAELAQHKQLTYDVSVARRISPQDESALVGYERRTDQMKRMAESRGVKVEDLENRGDALLLSPEQRARLESAQKDFARADGSVKSLQAKAAYLRQSIEKMGPADIGDERKNKLRATREAELKQVEEKIVVATAERGKSEAVVAEDAKLRGVTSVDYLRGKGWVDAEGLKRFREVQAERQEDQKKIEEIAKTLGVKPEDLAGATSVSRKLGDAQKKAMARYSENPLDVTRNIFKEYGLRVGDQASEKEIAVAKLFEGTAGRGMAQRILDSNRELGGIVDKKANRDPLSQDADVVRARLRDVDEMSTSYFKAIRSGKNEDMIAFRKSYGLYEVDEHGQVTGDSNNRFDKFQKAIQFQQQTGFLGFGRGREGKSTEGDFARMYSAAMGGGEMKPGGPGGPGGPQMPARVEMSGTVTLSGDQLDMSGAWGAGRSYTQPGGY